ALLYKDDHNKVAYLEKGKGWEAYEQTLDFLNRSHIRYALTHCLPIVFDSLVKQFWATATVRTLEAGPSDIIATIDGNEVVVTESLIRTQLQLNDVNGLYEFTLHDVLDGMRDIGYPTDGSLTFYKAKLSPQWRFLIHTLIHLVPAGGDGAAAVTAGAAAAHDVPPPSPPPIVPPTHSSSSTPGPSSTLQEPTPDSPRPPSPLPYPQSEESNEAPQTPAATAAGGTEDSAALTALSLKLDRCINRVTSLENELGVTKKVLGGVVLKLVNMVKRLEGLLQQRKRRLVHSDSEGEEGASKEQDIDHDALHKLASTSFGGDSTVEAAYTIYKASQDAHAYSDAGDDAAEVPAYTTMPFSRTSTTRRRLRKPFTSSASDHFLENIFVVEDTLPAGEGIPVAAPTIPTGSTTIPAGSSMDPAGQAAAATPLSTIPAADKGKASMVDDSLPADLLSEQERILKNLYDYQLGEELAKKLHAEQEAKFARQQEELAQRAQAKRVALPAEQGTGLSDQRRRELDAAQLIYTEADWLELMAKIATNSALSKQLLGDDVNEENMNERLGMLLMRKRRELAEQSRVKPMNKTQQRDYMRDFVKNQSASFIIKRTLERSNLHNFKRTTCRPAPSLEAPFVKRARQEVPQDVNAASLQVPAAPSVVADVSVPAAPSVAIDVSVPAVPPDPAVDSAHVDTEVHADESNPDDTTTASEQVSAEHTVAASTPLSLRTRRKHLAKKRVTPIVDIADDALIKFDSASDSDDDPLPYAPYAGWEMVPSPLGSVHAYYDIEGHTKHFTSLHEILHMVEKNDLRRLLGAVDNLYRREEPDTFALLFWRLYPRAQVYVLETVDGRVIYMFVDVSYPLSAATLQQLDSPEQTATGKDVSNPFMAVMVCQKPLGYFSSPMIHVPRAGLVINLPG
nr:xylulose kinase-1 [Tanacetum cinerariifolium]